MRAWRVSWRPLFVGPAALSAALGSPFDLSSDVFKEAAQRILDISELSSKYPGIYCSTPDDVAARHGPGLPLHNVCNDQSRAVRALNQEPLNEQRV